MSNWLWIDVGLVIIGDVGWLTASLVTDRRRRRKGPEEDEKCVCEVRSTSTRTSGRMCEENLAQAKRRMVTSTQTEELALHTFSEKFLAEAEPGARGPRREGGA